MKKIYVEELQAIAYLTMYEGLNKEILKAKVDPFVINHITKRLISAEEKLKSICNLKTSTSIDKEAIEIANASDPAHGVTKVMDLFSSQGGTQVASMLEALSATDAGKALLNKVGIGE